MEEEFHNHMRIPWHDYTRKSLGHPITEASLSEKASIIGRTGIMLLSCGTGAWRVRSSMNTLARELGITCTADIGLLSIEYTCIAGGDCYTESLCLFNTGVNTSKLYRMELFVNKFATNCKKMSGDELHTLLDQIHEIHGFYSPPFLGLAAAVACCAFTFLLGGGPIEMFCAFLGAGAGNYLRAKMNQHHLTLFLCTAASVALACVVYTISFMALKSGFDVSIHHQAGYICSMLFIIPGFPFITSGIDLAKLDMRSGLERLTYAIIIIAVATLTAWMLALVLHLKPMDFLPLGLNKFQYLIFRLIGSFFGVLGFSVIFNFSTSCGCIPWCFACRASGIYDQDFDWLSSNLSDGSFNCYYGPWIIFVSGNLQYWYYLDQYWCLLVYRSFSYYYGVASWIDLCKDYYR